MKPILDMVTIKSKEHALKSRRNLLILLGFLAVSLNIFFVMIADENNHSVLSWVNICIDVLVGSFIIWTVHNKISPERKFLSFLKLAQKKEGIPKEGNIIKRHGEIVYRHGLRCETIQLINSNKTEDVFLCLMFVPESFPKEGLLRVKTIGRIIVAWEQSDYHG